VTAFGLIHGANGSGAIWAGVVLELERRGHRAVAPDMPCDDVDAKFTDYAATLRDALQDDDAVVVGHSLGGCTCALIPARRHVYLAAMIPQAGRTLAECLKEEPMLDPRMGEAQTKGEDHLRYWKREGAIDLVFHDVPEDKIESALERLRGQSVTPYFETCEPATGVPASYIVCSDDRVVSPQWGRDAAPRLLGTDAIEFPGGHAPQLVRPRELAELLESL
jgi:pimeloyl-ACP methyl ester carboxylesterase